jgi:hypothetical protein
MTSQSSIVIGNLAITAQEVLTAAITLIQGDENVRLKVMNLVRASRNSVLEERLAALEPNGKGDMDDAGPHAVGEREEGQGTEAKHPPESQGQET